MALLSHFYRDSDTTDRIMLALEQILKHISEV